MNKKQAIDYAQILSTMELKSIKTRCDVNGWK